MCPTCLVIKQEPQLNNTSSETFSHISTSHPVFPGKEFYENANEGKAKLSPIEHSNSSSEHTGIKDKNNGKNKGNGAWSSQKVKEGRKSSASVPKKRRIKVDEQVAEQVSQIYDTDTDVQSFHGSEIEDNKEEPVKKRKVKEKRKGGRRTRSQTAEKRKMMAEIKVEMEEEKECPECSKMVKIS